MRRASIVLSLLLITSSCALQILEQEECDTFYFGAVSDDDFQAFMKTVVTSRFPSGVTSWSAENGKGEHIRVVQIVHAEAFTASGNLNAIEAEYRRRFPGVSVRYVTSRVWSPMR